MDVDYLKIFTKLKQLNTSFQLGMSSIQSMSEKNKAPCIATDDMKQHKEIVHENEREKSDISSQDVLPEDPKYSYDYNNESKTLNDVLQEFIPQIKISFEKWGETFKECENFENLYPTRLDEIIKEAQSLEQQLKSQKDALKHRLKILTRTLASTKDE